ncbi:glycosyltransferase family 2 protein [Methylovulum psychrotolerans]|uniref:Glycosyl transferase n=1 Tax=Methylovulum psychrotolerans TaxID=1704499 RepID=A0A1Z4BXM5_9GAMM|nr:glycosyltransferase family 2 protein [Methylovulum psychrotolerans]ASF46011.1 glycosyl transferase [Methylovulum psychrotolerans]
MSELSVLIVTYNSAPLLRLCLDSLMAQTLADFDIIVVDNASRDGTADIVRSDYPQIRLLANDTNLGFGNANNLALAQAQGRYLVLLNPDAVLPPDTLAKALQHSEATADAGMGGGLLQGTQGEWQPSARQFPSLLNDGLTLSGLANRYPGSRFFGKFDRSWADPLQAADVDWVPGAFAIIPRSLVAQIGLFDPRFFLYYEEVDLCQRIRKAGFKVYYWPDLLITHVGGASSETVDELVFSSAGKQLTLWRMRSQLLYYRKWHGWVYSWLAKSLEQNWHRLRAWRNAHRTPEKAAESRHIVQLWAQAWVETQGGLVSPPQPW